MTKYKESSKWDKRWFFIILLISFAAVFVFNYLTPMMSDDYTYGAEVNQAAGLSDLFRQEYNQYMHWIGRSVVHMILRIFLSLPVIVFKVLNSLCFMALTLLIYANMQHRKVYDPLVLLMITLGLWLFAVDFRQTILWQTGACNYLWGTTIILGFMTVMTKVFEKQLKDASNEAYKGAKGVFLCLGVFLFGVIAGWCSENTSGACLLYLLFLYMHLQMGKKRTSLPLMAAMAGNVVGFLFMALAPGNAERGQVRTELHSGLFGMVSRFQKITMIIRNYFFVLLAILFIISIVLFLQNRKNGKGAALKSLRHPFIYTFLFFATCYALILTTATQARAFFGAGIFLLMAVIQALIEALNTEEKIDEENEKGSAAVRGITYSVVAILSMYLLFVWFDCGANVARIYRDMNERTAYILEQKEAGETDITVGKVHTDFYNDFSCADEVELSDDPGYWTNVGYESYFGVESIRAIPYDDWAVQAGYETEEEAADAKAVQEAYEGVVEEKINSLPGWD